MNEASAQFNDLFNDVENNLRSRAGTERGETSFAGLLKALEGKHPVIRRFKNDLRDLAVLRNMLVHRSGPALAVPSDVSIGTLQKIHQLLTKPPSVLDIASKTIIGCTIDTSIHEVLQHMKEHDYTQLPVHKDGHLIGVLSSESIVRWLATKSEAGGILATEQTVEEIAEYFDGLNKEDFVARDTDAFAAEEKFLQPGRRINSLYVTERGLIEECLLGIVTIQDLMRLQQLMGNGMKTT